MSRARVLLALLAVLVVPGAVVRLLGPASPPAAGVADPDVEGYDDAPAEGRAALFREDAGPFLALHCHTCHSAGRARGGVALDGGPGADPAVWRQAAAAVASGRMPPHGRPRPAAAGRDGFLRWAAGVAGAERAERGSVRRLNRAEYNNTLRDLLGVSFRPADDFPADDTSDGFDTIAGALSVSPTLVEKYLLAAERAVAAAAGDPRLWRRLRTPPAQDDVPFVLRGPPPRRNDPVKGLRPDAADGAAALRALEIDRAYAALQAFTDRAYRRPVTHAEMARLMRFVETALLGGESADAGLKLAIQAVLVSPHFLFRVEAHAEGPASDFALAARLSYFLWSSTPDGELYRLAARGELREPRTLVRQVRRMLHDPRSRSLAENFGGQWLQTRALPASAPDPALFPQFDNDLRAAMRQETERFLDFLVRTDRSILELLGADYTFVNERLARHYGLAGVRGERFRRVPLAGTPRGGILTHASVLTATSGPTRTSPVKRGRWVLENILGSAVPPPPPGVDDLRAPAGPALSLRRRLEQHRSRAGCASCHARMDALGCGLENFDAVGAWRDRDGGAAVDASGELPDGQRFAGAAGLRAGLLRRPDRFARCLTEKLLVYALGRPLTAADRPAVDRIVRHAGRNGYRFSSLLVALVRSDLFLQPGHRPGAVP